MEELAVKINQLYFSGKLLNANDKDFTKGLEL